jgi:hypothetical protein
MKHIAIPLHQFASKDQRIVVGIPMYRMVSASWLYSWWSMDKTPCVGLVSVEGARLPLAMTRLTSAAFASFPQWEWFVVLEDDVIPPPDAFARVAAYDDKYDIVTALHFGHEEPYRTLAFTRRESVEKSSSGHVAGFLHECLTPDETRGMVENPGVYEVDAVPMGFTAIRRRVLENWPQDVLMWQPSTPMAGQDIHFCLEAKKQGYSIWVDSSLRCGHLSEVAVGYGHHALTNGGQSQYK